MCVFSSVHIHHLEVLLTHILKLLYPTDADFDEFAAEQLAMLDNELQQIKFALLPVNESL